MPKDVYKRKGTKQCPKCTKTFHKMGIANHISHCKGVADTLVNENLEQVALTRNEEESIHAALRRAHNDYSVLAKENEMLRRIISAYKESNNSLCHAMIELNEVEGRWR